MVKNDSMSSDINFIKEFEELKLKQGLLIESLKRKGKSEYELVLANIDSKLDFLVKIFKESNTSESEEDAENTIAKVIELLEEQNKLNDEKFNNLFEKLSSLNPSSSKAFISKNILEDSKVPVSNDDSNIENKKIKSEVSMSLPPPNFKVDSKNLDLVSGDKLESSDKKKKKKWF